MTLTAKDIAKIQTLYGKLERLQAERTLVKDMAFQRAMGEARKGTSGVSFHEFEGFSPEAAKEIRDIITKDIRVRAAKIVDELHKLGCEARLTE